MAKDPKTFGSPLVVMYIERDAINSTAAEVHALEMGVSANAYESAVPPAEACHARVSSGTPFAPRGSAGFGPTDPVESGSLSLKERSHAAVRALTPGLCGGRRFYTVCFNGGAADIHCDETRSVAPGIWKQEWFHVADAFHYKYNVSAVPSSLTAVRGQSAAARDTGSGGLQADGASIDHAVQNYDAKAA